MNERGLRILLTDVLAAAAKAETSSSRAACELAFEERLPQMLQARHLADNIELSESASAGIAAAMLKTAESQRAAEGTDAARNGHARNGLVATLQERVHGRRDGSFLRGRPALTALAAIAVLVSFLIWNSQQTPNPEAPIAVETPPVQQDQPIEDGSDFIEGAEAPQEGPGVIVERQPERPIDRQPDLPAIEREAIGRLKQVVGDPVVFEPGSETPTAAENELVVYRGSTLDMGDMGSAEIRYNDGSVVQAGYNARFTIESDRDMELAGGLVAAHAVSTSDARPFTIRTPIATAVALGTEFSLELQKAASADGEGDVGHKLKAVLQVKSGRVKFFNDVDSVVAGALTESTAVEGKAPTEPQRIGVLKSFVTYGPEGRNVRYLQTRRLSRTVALDHVVLPMGWTGLNIAKGLDGELRVVRVIEDSPARMAGLRVGDVIYALDGQPIETVEPVLRAALSGVGSVLDLTVFRNGTTAQASVQAKVAVPPAPLMEADFETRLNEATLPALLGDSAAARQALKALSEQTDHPAAFNNLGVVNEMFDELGPAIRSYKMAVKLDPYRAIYRRNLGKALQKIGNNRRCIEELEAALAIAPKYHDAVIDLIEAYHVEGRVDDALALLESAQADHPNCPHLYELKSFILYDPGRGYSPEARAEAREKALEAANEAVRLAPDLASAHYQVGFLAPARDSEPHYRKAIELLPGQSRFHVGLGHMLFNLRRFDKAEAEYRKAVEFGKDDPFPHYILGRHYSNTGLFDKGETSLRKSISLDELFLPARHSLALLFTRTNRYQEAEAELRTLIQLDSTSALAHMRLARVLQLTNRLDEAAVEYRAAAKYDPLDASLQSNVASFFVYWGEREEDEASAHRAFNEAVTYAQRAIEMRPGLFPALYTLGVSFDHLERLEEAEKAYRSAIVMNPRKDLLAELLRRQGHILMRRDLADEAVPVLQKAIELEPGHHVAHRRLSISLETLGRFQEAMKSWENSVKAAPNRPFLLASLGRSQIENHRWEEAVQTLRRCIAMQPDGPNALTAKNRLSFALIHLGQLEEAEEILAEALSRHPDNPETSMCWALLLAAKGQNLDEALQRSLESQRAAEAAYPAGAPGDYWQTLGIVRFKRGEFNLAIESLERAAERYGRVYLAAEALVTLGQVYEAKADVEAAADSYRRALAIEPDNIAAAKSLQRLGL